MANAHVKQIGSCSHRSVSCAVKFMEWGVLNVMSLDVRNVGLTGHEGRMAVANVNFLMLLIQVILQIVSPLVKQTVTLR